MSLFVRKYQPKQDWPAICEIHNLARPYELEGSFDPRAFVPLEQDPQRAHLHQCTVFVAQEKQTILGFAGIEGSYIAWLYVHPLHHRKGVGTALLQHCLALAAENPWAIACANNTNALNLYFKEGFVVEKEFIGDNAGYLGPLVKIIRKTKNHTQQNNPH